MVVIDHVQSKRIKDLETVLAISAVVLLISFISRRFEFAYASFAMLMFALIFKKTISFVVSGWLYFSEILGLINTTIILSVIFYLALTPIALLHRVFSTNPLQLERAGPDDSSYFCPRNHLFDEKDFENTW